MSLSLSRSRINLFLCIILLREFQNKGLEHLVLCPGSRSSPLALAVGGLAEEYGLKLYTVIDERSAAFLALGLSTASGKAAVVITTSGTAVANLLPAAVEADRSCRSIIFITADRPSRLKDCGANQTVNQEEFLKPVCRGFVEGPCEGIHALPVNDIYPLVGRIWEKAHQIPGPVHFNIPIEEPLHASYSEQKEIWDGLDLKIIRAKNANNVDSLSREKKDVYFPDIDPHSFGIILAGPWRGQPDGLDRYRKSLMTFQSLTNWPIFADPLSGLSFDQPGLISYWELLIASKKLVLGKHLQILRLGPISSSRALEEFLMNFPEKQILITENEYRPLDPLRVAKQYPFGFASWHDKFLIKHPNISLKSINDNLEKYTYIYFKSKQVELFLEEKFSSTTNLNQPLIVNSLNQLLPFTLPIMVSSSSVVRDLLTYTSSRLLSRICFSFRGASGIDGNISLAIGLSHIIGPLIHLCGDLAFLYDSNALLLSKSLKYPLILLLIDNNGGGIFKSLNLDKLYKGNIDDLFIMPQSIDVSDFSSAYGIPYKEIECLDDLKSTIEWGLHLTGIVLIRVCTNSGKDNIERKNIAQSLQEYIN